MALLRSWSPVIALQVEYSLLARTVEGDLVPLALDAGMGLTPWSPLAGGFLSGKSSGCAARNSWTPTWPRWTGGSARRT